MGAQKLDYLMDVLDGRFVLTIIPYKNCNVACIPF